MKKTSLIIFAFIIVVLVGCSSENSSPSSSSTSPSSSIPTPPTSPSTATPSSRPASSSNNSQNNSTVDTIAPVITLNGPSTIELYVGQSYIEYGAVVSDNIDKGLTYEVFGFVNTSQAGTYRLTYNATDRSGNRATPISRTVRVLERFQRVSLDRSNYTRYLGVSIDPKVNFRRTAYESLDFKIDYNRDWDYSFRMTYVVRWVELTPTGQKYDKTDYVYLSAFDLSFGKIHRFIGNCVEIKEVRLQSITGDVRIPLT